ncbi:MAG: penicillin-binding protein activator [Emcibacter sp.]|nr:penicillin-binding protein activator [Emcibacter sp.]
MYDKKQRKLETALISPIIKYATTILFMAFGLSGCGADKPKIIQDIASLPAPDVAINPEDDNIIARQNINLGILLPLTGSDASIGIALLNAATMALFDSQDQRLVLMPYDTKGTADGAVIAMTELLKQKPDLIIGPVFSHSINAIKPLAKNAGLNIIGFSNDYSVAGDGVFLLNFPIEEQIKRVINYASDQGYARYAALIPQTAYGTRALEIFKENVPQLNRTLAEIETYTPDSAALVDPVLKITNYKERRKTYNREIDFLEKLGTEDDLAQEMQEELKAAETIGDVDFDSILLPEGGTMLTTLAAWLSYYEIDTSKVKILGTGLWDDEMLFLEPQLHGGWFAAPDHTISHEFLRRYKEIYHHDSPRLATLAYDAVALAATLVRQEKIPDFSVGKLTHINGFMGIDGLFRFSSSGLVERGLCIYEVGPKSFTIIDPAPTNFIELDSVNFLPLKGQDITLKAPQANYSEAASQEPLPANDGRPFPYNPVQKDAVNKLY